MIDISTLDPRQLYLHNQLEGVMAGELELDQWGYWKNDDPEGSESGERKVTLFEVFRKPVTPRDRHVQAFKVHNDIFTQSGAGNGGIGQVEIQTQHNASRRCQMRPLRVGQTENGDQRMPGSDGKGFGFSGPQRRWKTQQDQK